MSFNHTVHPKQASGATPIYLKPARVTYRPEGDSKQEQVSPACKADAARHHAHSGSDPAGRPMFASLSTARTSPSARPSLELPLLLQTAYSTAPAFFILSPFQTYMRKALSMVRPPQFCSLPCFVFLF